MSKFSYKSNFWKPAQAYENEALSRKRMKKHCIASMILFHCQNVGWIGPLLETKYSRIEHVKFVEDSL